MLALDVVSRIAHVSTAIALVGGSVFMLFVLMPAASQLADESHDQLRAAVLKRWKRFVHGGMALLLISGIYNYLRAGDSHQGDALYHALLGTKMILALVVFFIAAALVGKSPKLQPIRNRRASWLKILLLLAAVIVGISGFVKVRGPADSPVTQTEEG